MGIPDKGKRIYKEPKLVKTGVCSEMEREIGHSVSRARLQRALIRTMVFGCLAVRSYM